MCFAQGCSCYRALTVGVTGQTARDIAEFNGRNKFQVGLWNCIPLDACNGFQVEKSNFDAVVQLLGTSSSD